MILIFRATDPALKTCIAEYSAVQVTILSYSRHLKFDTRVYIVKYSTKRAPNTGTRLGWEEGRAGVKNIAFA
jgi:hypothetical protein